MQELQWQTLKSEGYHDANFVISVLSVTTKLASWYVSALSEKHGGISRQVRTQVNSK